MTDEEIKQQQQRAQQEFQRAHQKAMQEAIRQQQEAQALAIKMQQQAQEIQHAIDNEPRQKYAVIAAIDLDRGFAKLGEIPWYYAEDLRWFKQITSGHICVMGRITYEDINKRLGEKAAESILPNRRCFVVSSTLKQDDTKNATVIKCCYDVVNFLTEEDIGKTVFFIGGERIFTEGISLANTVYLTAIDKTFECDKFFPVEYVDKYFVLDKMHKTETAPDLRFLTFVRK